MSMSKTSKLYQYLNHRMRVTIQDSRTLVGKFMAFDKHMNLVLGDCEEYRRIIPKGKKGVEKIQKRMLGLVILRGENVVSMTVEAPPSVSDSRLTSLNKSQSTGQGISKPGSRGSSIQQNIVQTGPLPGLSGPIQGFGTSNQKVMIPQTNQTTQQQQPLMFTPPPFGMTGLPPLNPMMMPPNPFGRGQIPQNLQQQQQQNLQQKKQ